MEIFLCPAPQVVCFAYFPSKFTRDVGDFLQVKITHHQNFTERPPTEVHKCKF